MDSEDPYFYYIPVESTGNQKGVPTHLLDTYLGLNDYGVGI